MGDDLPFGSRGGIGIRHYFPVDGEYDVEIRLHRNYVNYVRGMGSRHELEVRLDGVLVRSFVFGGEEPEGIQAPASYGGNQFGDPEWEEYMLYADANMRARFQATAGPHVVSVAFVRRFTEPEGVLQPRQSIFAVAVNEMRDGNAAVEHVAIGGPYTSTGPGDTPARRALFICRPESSAPADEEACAGEILTVAGAARLPAADRGRGPRDADGLLPRRPRRRRASTPASSSRSSACSSRPTSSSASSATRSTSSPPPPTR